MLRLMLPMLLAAAAAAAAETRETVQRMVLVRTTGSDLQPAATGFIYNKRGDGPESVVEMGESEVMEHLSKLYTRPAHAAHAAHATHASGERVIPVREHLDDRVDGVADVDYEQLFRDYRANYGAGRDYDDYLKDSKRFEGGLYRKYDGDSAEDDSGAKNHRYGKGNAGTYDNAKFESYSISRAHKKDHVDDDTHKKHAHHRGSGDEQNAAHGKEDARGFRGVYDDIHDEDREHGKAVKTFADEHNYHGAADRGHEHYGYEPEHHLATGGRGAAHAASAEQLRDSGSAEGHAGSTDSSGDAGSEGSAVGGSYGYKVEH